MDTPTTTSTTFLTPSIMSPSDFPSSNLSSTTLLPTSTNDTFPFPPRHSYPPFFSPQPNATTNLRRLQRWSSLIQSYCRHHRLFTLSLNPTSLSTSPLFTNTRINKRLSPEDARSIISFMASPAGDERAEWLSPPSRSSSAATAGGGGGGVGQDEAWIWWRKPEEWGNLIASWVDETGQKGVVLTLYELVEGELAADQEFHGLDMRVLQRSLAGLVKKGRAQVFGGEGQEGVKFF